MAQARGRTIPWYTQFFRGPALELWRRSKLDSETRLEVAYLDQLFGFKGKKSLLDIPCGNGRLALPLAVRGYKVTGLDLVKPFIKEAKVQSQHLGLALTWSCQDMAHLKLSKSYDGAYSLGNSFGYLTEDATQRFFKTLFKHLKPQGLFVLETSMVREILIPTIEKTLTARLGNLAVRIHNAYDPSEGRLISDYTFHWKRKTTHAQAIHTIFSIQHVLAMLRQAGFQSVQVHGGFRGQPFNRHSSRAVFLARRN